MATDVGCHHTIKRSIVGCATVWALATLTDFSALRWLVVHTPAVATPQTGGCDIGKRSVPYFINVQCLDPLFRSIDGLCRTCSLGNTPVRHERDGSKDANDDDYDRQFYNRKGACAFLHVFKYTSSPSIIKGMKRLVASHSQHFLRSPAFIAELIGHSNIRKNNLVIDIGAGSGAISAVLARRAKQVIAYEIEPHALELLRRNMARQRNVTIAPHDFLTAPLPTMPYKVFANIPFHLSSQIVRKLAFATTPPISAYLIVQKQFAQKLLVTSTHFHGALGIAIAPWWAARIRRPLKKTDFTPPPAVDTVLLELKSRETPLLPYDEQVGFEQFVATCFAEPRVYRTTSAPRDKKPSELTVEQWVALYQHR